MDSSSEEAGGSGSEGWGDVGGGERGWDWGPAEVRPGPDPLRARRDSAGGGLTGGRPRQYADVEEVGGELFGRGPKRRKRGGRGGKERALYGIFAEGDSDDEPDDFGGGKARARASRRLEKPVAFVKRAVQGGPAERPEGAPRAAPAAAAAPTGNAAAAAFFRNKVKNSAVARAGGGGAEAEAGRGGLGSAAAAAAEGERGDAEVLPSAFGQRVKRAADERRRRQREEGRRPPAGAAGPSQAGGGLTQAETAEIASFEQHTKGIGMKLLMKMGYKKGRGLGKNKEGIAVPVEARLRPKGMGMGFGDYQETKPEARPRRPAEAGEEGKGPEPALQWKKKPADRSAVSSFHRQLQQQREAPPRTKTVEAVLAETAEDGTLLGDAVLDMRGPEARLVNDMSQLGSRGELLAGARDRTPFPEVQRNVQMVFELVEGRLRKLDQRIRHEEESALVHQRRAAALEGHLRDASARLERLDAMTEALSRCERLAAREAAEVGLAELGGAFRELRRAYPAEYAAHAVHAIAADCASPRFAALLRGWDPAADPARGGEELRLWRDLLSAPGADEGGTGPDPYAELLGRLVLPPLRRAVGNWNPRDPDALLPCFAAWAPLLPAATAGEAFGGLVLPKLQAAVADWDERDARPEHAPHAWLHPWLPVMERDLRALHGEVKHKLARALDGLEGGAASPAARALVAPWRPPVFDRALWASLVHRKVVPQLAAALGALEVRTAGAGPAGGPAQELGPVDAALAWLGQGLVPAERVARAFDTSFWPQWQRALLRGLVREDADFPAVAAWYRGWKARLPEALLAQEAVRAQLNRALALMDRAVSGEDLGAGGEGPAAAAGEASEDDASESDAEEEEPSFKDLIEQYALERSIDFLPKLGREHDGMQVYSFGGVSVVLDGVQETLRANLAGQWVPASLGQLAAAQAGQRRR